MSNSKAFESGKLSTKLLEIANCVHDAADFCQGDVLAILALLRELEKLHREICDDIFQQSLPHTRHELYALLRDIESEGGWPYIERMKLQTLLAYLQEEELEKEEE